MKTDARLGEFMAQAVAVPPAVEDREGVRPPADGLDGRIARLRASLDKLEAAEEEELLDIHGFSALEAHRRAHAGLLSRARELRLAWAAGAAGLGAVVEFLAGDVVARHLLKADREFFPLFARESAPAGR